MHAVTHCIDITCIMKQWTPPWISLRFSVARQCGCVGKHRPSHVRCDLWPFPAAPIPVTRAGVCNPSSLIGLRRSRWLSDSGLWFPIATTGLWVWFLYTCHRHRRCTYSCARVMTVQNQSWPLEHTRFVPLTLCVHYQGTAIFDDLFLFSFPFPGSRHSSVSVHVFVFSSCPSHI